MSERADDFPRVISDSAGPAADSGLFPPTDRRIDTDDWLTAILADAESRVKAGPVRSTIEKTGLAEKLVEFNFAGRRDLCETLSWVVSQMVDGLVHVNHPRYLGLFNPAPTFPAQCAERIVSTFNPQLATATTSPFPVALEAHVIKAIAARAGMAESAIGHFTSGGSEANATALICALTHRLPAFASEGCRAFTGAPTLYISRDAHLAWLKIAHQAGIGRAAVKLIATDGAGRMDVAALTSMIAADQAAGCVPVMIASTAGTTGAGMIDPIAECAQVARQFDIWHHVDAAWGGGLLFSEHRRSALDGIGLADSMTIDAHKWLATSMGCGMFFTAHPGVISNAFQVTMDCMPSNLAGMDPYVTSFQWSRRFLGLRLFVGLAVAGWSGYGAHIEHSIRLSGKLGSMLSEIGWKIVNRSVCGVLCLRPPTGAPDAKTIADAVVEHGIAWISSVSFEDEIVVRACVTSGETTDEDIELVFDTIRDCSSIRTAATQP